MDPQEEGGGPNSRNALKDDACRFFTGMKDITMDLKRPIKNKL